MRTKADLDAAFAELVREADAAFPTTRRPATRPLPHGTKRRWLFVAPVPGAIVAVTLAVSLRPWDSATPKASPTPGASPSVGYPGHWASTDVIDGSAQTLGVSRPGRGATYVTRLHDTVATVACAGGPADVTGPGRLVSGELSVTFTVTCPSGGGPPVSSRDGKQTYVYHSDSDTLTDNSGNVWHRAAPGVP